MALRPSQPSQATGARKYQTTGQKRLMRTAPFFPTTVRSPPVPSYSYTDANLMRNHFGRVIMGFADGYGPFGIARHIRPLVHCLGVEFAVKAVWLRPEVVAQMEFLGWTEADKRAQNVARESHTKSL